MTRRRISTRELVAVFTDNGGICHICSGRIHVGEAWERSHPIPLELGGADDKSNWRPAHKKCHAKLTASVDIPAIAKAKRREARHLGIKRGRRPMDGNRNSNWKRKMSGETVRRT